MAQTAKEKGGRQTNLRYGLISPLLFFFFHVGCAPLLTQRIPLSLERPMECQELLSRIDQAVERAGVGDASAYPVPGFPYLRTNRFLSALKEDLKDEKERGQWLQLLQNLDLLSREKEISNLPDEALFSLTPAEEKRKELLSRVRSCSLELLNHDRREPEFYKILLPLVAVPDEYSFVMRTVGLYPLVAIPVAVTTENLRKKIRSWYEAKLDDLTVDGELTVFVPTLKGILSDGEIQKMIEGSRKNPMGIPSLSKDQEIQIASSFAPLFVQDVAGPYDRPGRLGWRGDRVEVTSEDPTVYYYISHAFFKGEPILQINYVVWYSERAGERSPGIERGHLDGLTARISLDLRGRPFMADVVNDCGCYHFFAPEKDRVDKINSKSFRFDPFVPQWFPEVAEGKRLGIRINSGWHQVQRLIATGFPAESIPYRLVSYDILEALPHDGGRTESIFDSKGIAKSTERAERFILFSMGIPSVGSMRQRGHHAIELIGREHFDDPYLFDKSFLFR